MYGKLIDGYLVRAPNPLQAGDFTISNPTETQLLEQEYCPIIAEDKPEKEGFIYTSVYVFDEDNNTIIHSWQKQEMSPEPSLEEQVKLLKNEINILIGADKDE